MGLEEITLDLSGLSGLIALSGENGVGKSSVLENLTPYRTLFSRTGNLNQHFYLRSSEKEFHFTHEGHEYRTLLKIDAESDRGEGFIWKDGVSEVDGKRQSYDRYIENLLGSQFLFQNSVFCSQDSNKLTDLRTGELRQLFAEFLRLDKLQAWETTAKQCVNIIDAQKDQVERRINAIGDVDMQIIGKQGDLRNLSDEIIVQTGGYNAQNDELGKKLKEISELREVIASAEVTYKRREDAEAALKALLADRAKLQEEMVNDDTYFRQRLNVMRDDLKVCADTLERKDAILKAVTETKNLEAMLEEAAKDISGFREEKAVIEKDISNIRLNIAELSRERTERVPFLLEKQSDLRDWQGRRLTALQSELNALDDDREEAVLRHKLSGCEEKMKDLDARDPSCASTTCSFIIGALQAKENRQEIADALTKRKEQIETARAQMEAKIADGKEAISILSAEIDALFSIEEERNAAIDFQISSLKESQANIAVRLMAVIKLEEERAASHQSVQWMLKDARVLAAKATEIAIAGAKKSEIEKQIAELNGFAADTEEGHIRDIQAKDVQVAAQKALVEEIGIVDTIGLSNQLRALDDQIAEIKQSIVETQQKISAREKTIAAVQTEIATLEASRLEAEAAKVESKRLAGEVADWSYIRDACSKTGLQALEIDGVCPHIQHDATNLLFLTFGANYSVKIQTYDELEKKEVFKIWVIREDGEEALLDNLSGGQKVWLLKALRLALTLLSKQKSGRNFNAGMADEEDGALSVENARAFVALYRSFMAAGGFESFYFITHKPECLSLADHVLNFREGGVDVE
jgi:exonuclease SbcC